MRIEMITIENFRGIQAGSVALDGNALLVGSNGMGKSTICEALDLALGPERAYRRPVIDEYDFYSGHYQEAEGITPNVKIDVILTDLSEEAERRFRSHLRSWSSADKHFADGELDSIDLVDGCQWALPIKFVGSFDPVEDDFVGGTYFSWPSSEADENEQNFLTISPRVEVFTRDDKRYCGLLYLRSNRTGNRALSFQRGSLLDTIIRLESTTDQTWEPVLAHLRDFDVASADSGFTDIQTELITRFQRFLRMAPTEQPVGFRVSDLTRENLRETLRLFVATEPADYAVPFSRLSTGTLNLLVFAMLTYIADIRENRNVIFVMEEPEIALPPHAQRRLVDFALKNMSQLIVTSHSPYVIEKFHPEQVVVLSRSEDGNVQSSGVSLPEDFKAKRYRQYRHQFSEALLAKAVLVVEGATEAAILPIIADVLESDESCEYEHLDLAGVSIFDAQNDCSVPLFAPVFKGMGKFVFGIHDTPSSPFTDAVNSHTSDFDIYRVVPYSGIEKLLVEESPMQLLRNFLSEVSLRDDYPSNRRYQEPDTDSEVRTLTFELLKARKGSADGYAVILMSMCRNSSELPHSLRELLLDISAFLSNPTTESTEIVEDTGPTDGA